MVTMLAPVPGELPLGMPMSVAGAVCVVALPPPTTIPLPLGKFETVLLLMVPFVSLAAAPEVPWTWIEIPSSFDSVAEVLLVIVLPVIVASEIVPR
jgi:hypothetical protein